MTIQSTETDTTTFSYQIQINFDSVELWVDDKLNRLQTTLIATIKNNTE